MFFLDQYDILLLHPNFYNLNKETNTCLAFARVLKDLQLLLIFVSISKHMSMDMGGDDGSPVFKIAALYMLIKTLVYV